ncbi:MAG: hypothetical protein F4107_08580 [Gemmatimonadetes bacterium]|nr:hypothetical protein [Gemmatimonadota bacterium]MYD13969.1 hypothetical protein [Gemmatimonadota bacterium]MYI65972.1 hypothetical protein [Gemmatimonadota bacterium]
MTGRTFDMALAAVVEQEGGYQLVHDSGDPMGQSYAGISRRRHPTWQGWPILDQDAFAAARVHRLVAELYRDVYWNPLQLPATIGQRFATMVLSAAVSVGVQSARLLLQDSRGGRITFAVYWLAYYADMVRDKPELARFQLGWFRRVLTLL